MGAEVSGGLSRAWKLMSESVAGSSPRGEVEGKGLSIKMSGSCGAVSTVGESGSSSFVVSFEPNGLYEAYDLPS